MDNAQASHVIKFLNASWAVKPLDGSTAAIWGAKLKGYDFTAVMAVLEELVETLEWRPSLARILKPLRTDPDAKTAAAAFADVWEQASKRPPQVTALEAEAVRRIGGWDSVRGWQIDERHWHAKRFADIYGELTEAAKPSDYAVLPQASADKVLLSAPIQLTKHPGADRLLGVLKKAGFAHEDVAKTIPAPSRPMTDKEIADRKAILQKQVEQLREKETT